MAEPDDSTWRHPESAASSTGRRPMASDFDLHTAKAAVAETIQSHAAVQPEIAEDLMKEVFAAIDQSGYQVSPKKMDRSASARLAAKSMWERLSPEERKERSEPSRRRFNEKFLREADGDPVRAAELKSEHYRRMSAASARTRRKKKRGATDDA